MHVLRLPEPAELLIIFYFEKALWKSVEAVVVSADAECMQICALDGV